MPYIPWADYGICKFWMLKRCYSGSRCQWRHPPPAERKRLWDDKTAEQDEAAARGVPRPKNPRLNSGDSTPRSDIAIRQEERVHRGSRAPVDASIRSLSPLPRPPRFSIPASQARIGFEHLPAAAQHRDQSARSAATGPRYEQSSRIAQRESTSAVPDVSMLDAPDSPQEREPSEVNPRPLDGPNRLASHREKNKVDIEDDFAISLDGSPGADTVTVWKRVNAITSAAGKHNDRDMAIAGAGGHMVEGRPKASDYWTRFKDGRGATSTLKAANTMAKGMIEGEEEAAVQAKRLLGQASASVMSNLTPCGRSRSPKQTSTLGSAKLVPTNEMGAMKRMSNGEAKHVGPHPSTIRVSARYASQASIEQKLQPQPAASAQAQSDVQERLTAEAREDSIRLQGCRWLDDVRRQMQLPVRTFTTACTYYHKFRLAHPQTVAGMEYGNAWADACAASLLTACKVEDTLKKSKDILAAAHNLRAVTAGAEQVGTDDAMFEAPSRVVIGLERLVLEAGSFDFRSKYPHELMVKLAKTLDGDDEEKKVVTQLAWSVLTDLHRTFTPLKQTSATMAVASLELAAHLYAAGTSNDSSVIRDSFGEFNFLKYSTTREEVMETILDALDLYTHHTSQTLLGSTYGLDDYLRIRLAFNKECTENSIPRFTAATPREQESEATGNTLRVQNGHPTPVSPPQPDTQSQAPQPLGAQPTPEGGGTQRFMLNPQLAADEKSEVQKYFVEEWEEYEEEIEVPLPRATSTDRSSERSDRRPPAPSRVPPPGPPRAEYRGGSRYDDRRVGRSDDRRYDDRRYDDRRGGRYDDRSYDDRRRR